MLGGIEIVADKATKRNFDVKAGVGGALQRACEGQGLILRAIGDIVAFCPPLIVKEADIDDIYDRAEKALDETEAWVTKEGLRSAL